MPHAEILRSDAHDQPAIPAGLDLGELGRRAAVVLHVHRDTEAAALATALARRAARREPAPVSELERAIEVRGEGARGHDGAARGGPGKRGRLDEVAPPQLDPVD